MTNSLPLMGSSEQLRHMADDGLAHLGDLISELKRAGPADRERILKDIDTWKRMCRWILSDAAERVDRKATAARNAIDRADHAVRTHTDTVEAVALTNGFDPKGYFVYLLVAANGDILYVGQSENVLGRIGSHLSDRKKYRQIHTIHLIRCRLHRQMMRLEAGLIAKHCPPWNTVGVPVVGAVGRATEGPTSVAQSVTS